MSAAAVALVAPGDELGSSAEFEAGPGTYVDPEGRVRAALVGVRSSALPPPAAVAAAAAAAPTPAPRPVLAVVRAGEAGAVVPEVGSVVLARVTRLGDTEARLTILALGETPLAQPRAGVLRREHVRDTHVDSVRMVDVARPGDVVRALVVSLGDARSYVLSVARPELGVVAGTSDAGHALQPVAFDTMRCTGTGALERRKVARPEGV
jgi:exosome complex component CSL4